MITDFDLNTDLFVLLNNSGITISGGVYIEDDRPDNSQLEDIVINTIDVTLDTSPQLATSNVNIYVPDKTKNINGTNQIKSDRIRLRELTKYVIKVLKDAKFEGMKLIVMSSRTMFEPNTKQHYQNIRIEWNIQLN